MLTKEQFAQRLRQGVHLLDGATGSNLRAAGMPKGCCTEQWVLEHPEPLVALQRAYAAAGAQILYAPTFQAQPIALASIGWEARTEQVNEMLVALTVRRPRLSHCRRPDHPGDFLRQLGPGLL